MVLRSPSGKELAWEPSWGHPTLFQDRGVQFFFVIKLSKLMVFFGHGLRVPEVKGVALARSKSL